MAGFYIHIPLCRKVCYYCDFHFVASLKQKDKLIEAICKEIEIRSSDWADTEFSTIYFGGGTPSVLSVKELNTIITQIYTHYRINAKIEFTLEANPDDLSFEYLKDLKQNTPVNRLSIGIQSFHDKDLTFINRRHNSSQAINCIHNAKKAGFNNITIDLIYGIPGLTLPEWEENVETFLRLNIPHLAAYHLSIEPKTVFGVFEKKNKIKPIDEELSVEQYKLLTSKLMSADYEHYEISNFSREGKYSKHNTGYWIGKEYIGIGPSAHSYRGNSRRWNVANNTKYCESIEKGHIDFFETENLNLTDRFNDYLLTTLRTKWGAELNYIQTQFGEKYLLHLNQIIDKYLNHPVLEMSISHLKITEEGWLVSDAILADLFYQE